MNASFISLGLTMIIGATLVFQEFHETKGSLLGFSFMGIAGFGTLLVGLFPENTIGVLHYFGASLPFFVGNVGIVMLSVLLDTPKALRVYGLVSGIFSLIALALFSSGWYLELGIGGMERLAAYPQTMWLIVFGVYISSNHIRAVVKKPNS